MRIKAAFILCFLICFINDQQLEAQQLGGTASDPNIASKSDAGGTSISSINNPDLYDGSTNLNFSIFNYSSPDGDDLGVSFRYNTKGIRADQDASSVGLGFVLSAGGTIQRVIKDIPDELNNDEVMDNNDPSTYYGGYINFNKIRGRYAASFETTTQAAETDVYRDKESDDFIVSIGGLSFTFNIGKQRAIFTNPDRRIKIELLRDGVAVESLGSYPVDIMSLLEFKITDERGVQYYFKPGSFEFRKVESAYGPPGQWDPILQYNAINSWVIDKVVASNGVIIQYTYVNLPSGPTSGADYATASSFENAGITLNESLSNPIWAEKAISKIEYPNNTVVDFLYEDNPNVTRCDISERKALKKIKVSSGTNCLYYLLDHAYFAAATPNNSVYEKPYGGACESLHFPSAFNSNYYIPSSKVYRLKLKGIRIQSCDATLTEPYYTFDYDPTPIGIKGSGQDYFGFYNGKLASYVGLGGIGGRNEYLSIPNHKHMNDPSSPWMLGMNKEPDINYMKAGILTKVRNAFGGEILFEYGEHEILDNPIYDVVSLPDVADGFWGEHAADGLCLKEVVEKDDYHTSNYKKTTYTYENGQKFLVGGYFWYPSKYTDGTSNIPAEIIYNSSYVTPHEFVNGSNHGYGKVTVEARDNNNKLLSKRITTFTNFKDETSGNQPRYLVSGASKHYFTFPFTQKQYIKTWEMGLPLSIEEYDEKNHLLKKIESEYDFLVDNSSADSKLVHNEKVTKVRYTGAPAVATNWGASGLNAYEVLSFSDNYKPVSGVALLKQSKTYTYQSDYAYTLDLASFGYDDRKNLKETLYSRSDGKQVKNINFYNYSTSNANGTLLNLNNAGLELKIGWESWIMDGQSLGRLIDASFNAYDFNSGKLTLKNVYAMKSAHAIPLGSGWGINLNTIFSGGSLNNLQKISEVTAADVHGNPLESRINDQEIYKAMIWDIPTGHKLAEANCRIQDIAYSGFEVASKGNWNYDESSVVSVNIIPGGGINGDRAIAGALTNPNILATNALTAGKEYIISLWCNGGVPVISGGGVGAIPLESVYNNGGGWIYYEARFTPLNTTPVIISGNGNPGPGQHFIDEVRLFPSNAQMQSWTYTPLFGVRSQTDPRGVALFYEYDKMGRQVLVRDQKKNILSKTRFVTQGQQ